MEGSNNNNENDSNVIKKFLLEITGKFKTNSTIEYSNYEEALESFNQHYKSGKNLILYEVHKSTLDGSVVKKVPVLNTSKHAERMRIMEEQSRINSVAQNIPPSAQGQQSSSNQKNKMTFANMKFKIIILAAVVGGLIITLFLLNFLASGGSDNMAGHLIGFDASQNYYLVQSSLEAHEVNPNNMFQ